MKKIFSLFFTLTIISGVALAQTASDSVLRSKRGFIILPEANEWALGISANPFFTYLGNIFNNTANNNAPTVNYTSNSVGSIFTNANNNVAIFGKKMIDAHTAYRARFNVSSGTTINKATIAQDQVTPNPSIPAFVDDWQKVSRTTVVLSAGMEKRRGKGRVQGIYGAELVIGFTSGKTTYQYGNPFSLNFNTPGSTNFTGSNNAQNAGSRVTENKSGASFLVGARGFVGVEYFIAPKISLGGEFGYMLGFQTTGKSYLTTESWNSTTNTAQKIKTDSYNNNGLSSIGIGLDNLNGSINLLFYF